MEDKGCFNYLDVSCILMENNKIVDASREFTALTQYNMDDLTCMNIEEIFKLLRMGPNINIKNINEKADYFLFSKSLEVRLVNIKVIKKMYKQVYIIREKPNSRFEVKHEYLAQLCKSNVVGVAVYTVPNMILVKANQKYLNFLEPPFDEKEYSLGNNIEKIIPCWRKSSVKDFWDKAINTGITIKINEYEHMGYEKGITYWESIITPISEEGKVKYVVSNTFDVTEKVLNRKKIQEQMEAINLQNKQMKVIFENIPSGIFVNYKDGNTLQQNNLSSELANKANQINLLDDKHKHIKFLTTDGKSIAPEEIPPFRALKGEKIKNERISVLCNEKETTFDVSSSPVYDDDNNILMSVTSVNDVTEVVKQEKLIKVQQDSVLQAERERNEALEKAINMKDEFLSIISHEFRTPLNVISSAVQAMQCLCYDELSENSKKYLRMIKLNTFRQLRLVNNLLDLTRTNAGIIKINKKNLDIIFLTKAIVDSVKTYAYQKGIDVTFISPYKEMIIGIDDEKYERIILNILSNAIKFTPDNKSITVKINVVKNNVCIKIKDEGIGIPKDKIDTIFERFGQVDSSLSRQAEGTGIGLSLVKKLVEALEGKISVKSEVGKGSTFKILLPNEKVVEEQLEMPVGDLFNNKLVQITNVELSDIYM